MICRIFMQKNTRILLLLLVLVLVLVVSRRYLAPKKPNPAIIAQVLTEQKSQQPALASGIVTEQEMIVPEKAIASVQESDGADLIPVEGAKTYSAGQGSMVQWLWRRIGGETQGTVTIRQWAVQVVDDIVVWGAVIFDMNSIATSTASWGVLSELLKWDEFFAVQEYPTASFIVQEVGGGQIIGVLTMKWVSKQISFPGIVIVEADSVVVTAELAFDRKQWGVSGWGPEISEFIELSFTIRFVP